MITLFLLTGPPAAGKTTLSSIARQTIERVTMRPVIYLSSELILRIQALSVAACASDSPIKFVGSQLIVEDDFREAVTSAAVRGVASTIESLEPSAGSISLLVEIPEAGLPVFFDSFSKNETTSWISLLLIWLDAPFDCRLIRNATRVPELRLTDEAMLFFEQNRVALEKQRYVNNESNTLFLDTARDFDFVSELLQQELEAAIRQTGRDGSAL